MLRSPQGEVRKERGFNSSRRARRAVKLPFVNVANCGRARGRKPFTYENATTHCATGTTTGGRGVSKGGYLSGYITLFFQVLPNMYKSSAIVTALFGVFMYLYLNGYHLSLLRRDDSPPVTKEKVFSREELSMYDGLHGFDKPLYLAILGRVFDVTEGIEHYKPGASYHGFTGKDGSKAFITGDFTEHGLTDDIGDLDNIELLSLLDWVKMYEKNYILKGLVEGHFYDSSGNPTFFLKDIQQAIKEAEDEKKMSKEYEQRYPPCNIEWTQESGNRVWCSQKSGGVVRSWIGVPRKYYEPGATDYRCACVNFKKGQKDETVRHGMIEMFKECPADSHSCYVRDS